MVNATGMPIWYELLTTDPDAARHFYGEIVGWTPQAMPNAGGMDYTVWEIGGTGIGGLATPPPGAPAGWLAYFHVADVDAKIAEVKAAGGTVPTGGYDIPDVGRIALVTDPQGAPFYLMTPTPPPGMEDAENTSFHATLPGRCGWNELVTSDQTAALPFYTALLGWTSDEVMPMGPMGDYSFLDCAGTRIGAMMNRAAPEQPTKWTCYFKVPDVDAAAPRIAELGGTVIMGPMEVPGGQRIVLALDPQGASVGFVSGERQ